MAGFKTKLRVPVDLVELYVPLHAMVDLRATGESCFADARDAEGKNLGSDGSLELELTRAFVEADRRKRKGLVILGDPGSGKTTHLKRLLLWCLSDRANEGPEALGLPRDMVPVFLPLRELRDVTRGLDAFIEEQLDQEQFGMQEGFGKRLLESGNLLLLLDGLDEVPDLDHRKQVSRWIETARSVRPTCRFVVTSRFAGYTPEVQLSGYFLELHIRPLTAEQASRFVHNWYRIVESGLAPDPEQGAILAKERADGLVGRLNTPEFKARRVFELTRNPLLLANICLVHRDRGSLPERRAKLYDECVDVLLERWRESKQLPIQVPAETARRVLGPVALHLHAEKERTRAHAQELLPVIEPELERVRPWAGTARDFLQTIRDESGLLTGWGDGSYGFMHLGFQEFLAAREILRRWSMRESAEQQDLKDLAGRCGDGWWQEVTLLLLALENAPFEPFMREVLNRPAVTQHQDLLELCLGDAIEVSDKPFVELVQQPAGQDRNLWARQLIALKALERLNSSSLPVAREELSTHPSSEIQAWLQGRTLAAVQAAESKAFVHQPSGCELVLIPGGHFMMGSPQDEEGRASNEGPVHKVTVQPFYLGRYPVTNEQYARFLSANPGVEEPRFWADRQFNQPRQPVVGVSWSDAKRYAEWAGLALPSEAQWEYACRAGTETRYYSGDTEADLARVGWYRGNSDDRLHPIGEKEPNAYGLYDMHGNTWEWCEDDWHDDYKGAPTDGSAWIDQPRGANPVLRGGSWGGYPLNCRSACRGRYLPDHGVGGRGFRVLLDFK